MSCGEWHALIHLAELGVIDLLADFSRVIVPEAVWSEVSRHRLDALAPAYLEKVSPPPANPGLRAIGTLYSLHRGEWQALAICNQYAGSRLLTDDAAARLAAKALSVPASGTIGVLLRAMRTGRHDKSQTLALLDAIPRSSSLHIRPSLLTEIIAEVQAFERSADD